METQIKKVGEKIQIVTTIDQNELAKITAAFQTELFEIAKHEPKIENVFNAMHKKTIKFIRSLIYEYGTEMWIEPNADVFQNLRWSHRIDDVAQVFRNLQNRGAMVVQYNDKQTRIIRFKFNNNVDWTWN